MQYIYHLAYLAVVLLIGTLASVLAYSLKTSDILILLITGMILANLGVLGFNKDFIIIVSILALIFIVFSSTVKFNFKELKKYFPKAMKLNTIYLLFCLVFLTASVIYIFDFSLTPHSILLGLMLAVLTYGIDPSSILSTLKNSKNRFVKILEIESLINTTLMVIFSFLILTTLGGPDFKILANYQNPLFSFLHAIVVGVLVAVLLSWILIKALKNNFLGETTHLIVLTSAILAYVASEILGGSGVLSIAVFGLLFGNSHISHLIELEKFESILANIIKIMTFMILGTIIIINPGYVIRGTIIFLIYLFIRFVSILLSFAKDKWRFKQIIFMTLNVPKGVDVAVVLLLMISVYSNIKDIQTIINLVMLIFLYSIALSAITTQFSSYFLTTSKGK